eukprot:15435567-Alexandrium_andersonii.AAC.1
MAMKASGDALATCSTCATPRIQTQTVRLHWCAVHPVCSRSRATRQSHAARAPAAGSDSQRRSSTKHCLASSTGVGGAVP